MWVVGRLEGCVASEAKWKHSIETGRERTPDVVTVVVTVVGGAVSSATGVATATDAGYTGIATGAGIVTLGGTDGGTATGAHLEIIAGGAIDIASALGVSAAGASAAGAGAAAVSFGASISGGFQSKPQVRRGPCVPSHRRRFGLLFGLDSAAPSISDDDGEDDPGDGREKSLPNGGMPEGKVA